jgi:hypothetical protein
LILANTAAGHPAMSSLTPRSCSSLKVEGASADVGVAKFRAITVRDNKLLGTQEANFIDFAKAANSSGANVRGVAAISFIAASRTPTLAWTLNASYRTLSCPRDAYQA